MASYPRRNNSIERNSEGDERLPCSLPGRRGPKENAASTTSTTSGSRKGMTQRGLRRSSILLLQETGRRRPVHEIRWHSNEGCRYQKSAHLSPAPIGAPSETTNTVKDAVSQIATYSQSTMFLWTLLQACPPTPAAPGMKCSLTAAARHTWCIQYCFRAWSAICKTLLS